MKTILFLSLAAFAPAQLSQEKIAKEVRHELVMLPYYGVFDNLAYRVDGGKVTLFGQVTRPTLKSDAENVVKRLEGVERVDNEIEVLPLSPMTTASAWRSTAPYFPSRHCSATSWEPCRRSTSSLKTETSRWSG